PAVGTYVFRLTASDGALSSSSDVTITVNGASSPGVLAILSPLTLDKTTVMIGQTLNATVTYQNTGGSPIALNQAVITSRPPGATNSSGPFDDLSPRTGVVTVQPGPTLTLPASRSFTSSDPTGAWYSFVNYHYSPLVGRAG